MLEQIGSLALAVSRLFLLYQQYFDRCELGPVKVELREKGLTSYFSSHWKAEARCPWRSARSASMARAIRSMSVLLDSNEIMRYGLADLCGMAGFSMGLMRERQRKCPLRRIHGTVRIMAFEYLSQNIFSGLQFISVIEGRTINLKEG